MRDRTAWCTAVALAASLPPLPQSQPRIVLAPANATLQDDFIALTSLRELSDGRVLLTDGRSQQIFVADFAAGSVTPVARNGKGPLEYSFIGTLYATGGDSTIMLDVGNQRWLLFSSARVVGTVPPDHPAVKLASPLLGSDRLGRVVTTRRDDFVSGVREYTRNDSQAVRPCESASRKGRHGGSRPRATETGNDDA